MLGGADNANGELLSYIIGADHHPALLMFPFFAIFQQGNLWLNWLEKQPEGSVRPVVIESVTKIRWRGMYRQLLKVAPLKYRAVAESDAFYGAEASYP